MVIRWQDWADVLLGGWLAVSPWQMGYSLNHAAGGNASGVGAALVAFNLMSACRIWDEGQEIVNILLGAWLILSPYALNFASDRAPAINAIVVGVIAICLAGWQMYDATRKRPK